MKIQDLPAFYSTQAVHYYYEGRTLQQGVKIDNICIQSNSGRLENKMLGINFDVYVSADQFQTQPKLNDILVIEDKQYQIITNILKMSNFDIDNFYKLTVKTTTVSNLPQ